jgi:hypothetical protein
MKTLTLAERLKTSIDAVMQFQFTHSREGMTALQVLIDTADEAASALRQEPVAWVVQSKNDGSIDTVIAPVKYIMFDLLLARLNDDPWVKLGVAEIVPLYAAPHNADAQEIKRVTCDAGSDDLPVLSPASLHPPAPEQVAKSDAPKSVEQTTEPARAAGTEKVLVPRELWERAKLAVIALDSDSSWLGKQEHERLQEDLLDATPAPVPPHAPDWGATLGPAPASETPDVRGEICKIVSAMLDNPDAYGISPTTKCYNELEQLVGRSCNALAARLKEVERDRDSWRRTSETLQREKGQAKANERNRCASIAEDYMISLSWSGDEIRRLILQDGKP